MISFEYICKNGHSVWIKHTGANFQAQRLVKCFECGLKMSRTGNQVTKPGKILRKARNSESEG